MEILPAQAADLPGILELQRRAFQREVELLGNPDIQPMRQTLAELEAEFGRVVLLKLVDEDGGLLGSVRVRLADGTGQVGKLMVRPELQGRGLGYQLLLAAEAHCPAPRYELFTSAKSVRNIALYERAGYRIIREETGPDGPMVVMEKPGTQ